MMDDDAETGTIIVHNKTYGLAQLSKDERHRYSKKILFQLYYIQEMTSENSN